MQVLIFRIRNAAKTNWFFWRRSFGVSHFFVIELSPVPALRPAHPRDKYQQQHYEEGAHHDSHHQAGDRPAHADVGGVVRRGGCRRGAAGRVARCRRHPSLDRRGWLSELCKGDLHDTVQGAVHCVVNVVSGVGFQGPIENPSVRAFVAHDEQSLSGHVLSRYPRRDISRNVGFSFSP